MTQAKSLIVAAVMAYAAPQCFWLITVGYDKRNGSFYLDLYKMKEEKTGKGGTERGIKGGRDEEIGTRNERDEGKNVRLKRRGVTEREREKEERTQGTEKV